MAEKEAIFTGVHKKMGDVIQFPVNEIRSWIKVKTWVEDVLKREGLTDEMIGRVLEQYKSIYDKFTICREFEMKISVEAQLTKEQRQYVKEAHDKTVQEIFEYFVKLQAEASHIILGLLAKVELSRGN